MTNPSWLPDPTRRFEHRYWNGSQWTDEVSRAGVPTKDPLSEQPAPPSDVPVAAAIATASGDKKGFGAVIAKSWRIYRGWPKWAQITTAVIVVIVVIAAMASGGSESDNAKAAGSAKTATEDKSTEPSKPTAAPSTTPAPTTPAPTTTAPTTTAPTTTAPKPTAPPAPVETPGQSNARRGAQQYLSLGNGFSRAGLIQQLSSEFGERFSLEDATYGVDATPTDWNAQACLSAKGYLKLEPFSHAGLVEQLSSEFGERYTPAEAEYGVTCAGL